MSASIRRLSSRLPENNGRWAQPTLQILAQDAAAFGVELAAVGNVEADAVDIDQDGPRGAEAADIVVAKEKFNRAAVSDHVPLVRLFVPFHADNSLDSWQEFAISQLLQDELTRVSRNV